MDISALRHRKVSFFSARLKDRPPQTKAVCKTHDYPPPLQGRDDLRCIFIFGSPIEAIRSVVDREARDREKGTGWIAAHFHNLRATGGFDELPFRDVLGFEAQIDAWTGFTGAPVICVRYEALWREISKIEDFTGLTLKLPEWRPRRIKHIRKDIDESICRTYSALEKRVADLPDIFKPTSG